MTFYNKHWSVKKYRINRLVKQCLLIQTVTEKHQIIQTTLAIAGPSLLQARKFECKVRCNALLLNRLL
jgi:hypothetical protein